MLLVTIGSYLPAPPAPYRCFPMRYLTHRSADLGWYVVSDGNAAFREPGSRLCVGCLQHRGVEAEREVLGHR